jgi:hypothetical protein
VLFITSPSKKAGQTKNGVTPSRLLRMWWTPLSWWCLQHLNCPHWQLLAWFKAHTVPEFLRVNHGLKAAVVERFSHVLVRIFRGMHTIGVAAA